MKYKLNLDTDGRILSATFESCGTEDMPTVDKLPDGNIAEYRYLVGEYVHDPITPEPEESKPTLAGRVAELESALEMILSGVVE